VTLMETLSIVYCNGASPSTEDLEQLKLGLDGVVTEILEAKPSGPHAKVQLTPTLSYATVPSLGHALFEITGAIVHCISTRNTCFRGVDYREVLRSFAYASDGSLAFVSHIEDNEGTFQAHETRDLRRASFLRILNDKLPGKTFLQLARNSDVSQLRGESGTFFLRRSALSLVPPAPGVDEASVAAILPIIAARSGACINRSDLILKMKSSSHDGDSEPTKEVSQARDLVAVGWALEWWASQSELSEVEDFTFTAMAPFDVLRLSCQYPYFARYLFPSILKRIDLMAIATKWQGDATEPITALFSSLAKINGGVYDPARIQEITTLTSFQRNLLQEVPTISETASKQISVAETALKRGDFQEAATLFESLVSKYPNCNDAHLGWAEAAVGLGQREAAKERLAFVQGRASGAPSICLRLGNLFFKTGEIDEAKRHYQQSICADSNNPASYFNMAIILSREGKFDEGLRHARAALRCQPEDATLNETVAFLEFKCGHKEEAVSMLSALLARHPQRPETQALLRQVQTGE
jgi:tetratricopeptide (TPR) repeat protein